MKILDRVEHKTITYMGFMLEVPEEARYVATDKNGIVCAYVNKPDTGSIDGTREYWWFSEPVDSSKFEFLKATRRILVARVDLHDMDWRETLVDLENPQIKPDN